jgi:hypothetical protein
MIPIPKPHFLISAQPLACLLFFTFHPWHLQPLIVFGLLVTRAFKVSEWVVALLGIIAPYYFLLAYIFLTINGRVIICPGVAVTIPHFYESRWASAAIIIVLFTSVTGMFYIQQNFRRQLVQARKSWSLIFLYLVIALFIPFINASHSFNYWILMCGSDCGDYSGRFFVPDQKMVSAYFALADGSVCDRFQLLR